MGTHVDNWVILISGCRHHYIQISARESSPRSVTPVHEDNPESQSKL